MAELASTHPQSDKSVGRRRVSSMEEGVEKCEAALKELGRTESSDQDSGRIRQGSRMRRSPAASPARQQRRTLAEPPTGDPCPAGAWF
ncbi:hypothetical protein MTO96_050918 [Rhipicephalus appendiculatus]